MTSPTPEDQAAEWLVRCDRGLTSAQQDEFLQWLASDPRHAEALARHQETWKDLDLLADWRPAHAPSPNPALLAPPRARKSRPLNWVIPFTLVAACLAFVTWSARDYSPDIPASLPPPAVATGYEKRVLEDGSILELNRGASVEVAFTPTERRLRLLSGEAHFTVAKNPFRPFVVAAGGVETRAVGTAFNVRLASTSVEVLVTEGSVQVTPTALIPAPAHSTPLPESSASLVAQGEQVTVPLAVAEGQLPPTKIVPIAVTPEEIARKLDWQPRFLEFSSTPLAEVIAEFNRYNSLQLALADPVLAHLPVSASFRSDNVEGFVRLLEATADVRGERRGETISLRRRNSP